MKKKSITILALLMTVLALCGIMAGCNKASKTPSDIEQAQDAVKYSVMAKITVQHVLGNLPDDWYYSYCTFKNTVKTDDGGFKVTGTAHLQNGSQTASASFFAEVDSDFDVKSCTLGTFYRD